MNEKEDRADTDEWDRALELIRNQANWKNWHYYKTAGEMVDVLLDALLAVAERVDKLDQK